MCIREGVSVGKMPRPASAPSPAHRRPAAASAAVRPGDAYLGPAAGKMTVYENLRKLNYDLVRAEERSKHADAVRADMARKQRIYEENVLRVKGALLVRGAARYLAMRGVLDAREIMSDCTVLQCGVD